MYIHIITKLYLLYILGRGIPRHQTYVTSFTRHKKLISTPIRKVSLLGNERKTVFLFTVAIVSIISAFLDFDVGVFALG
jgi:hypothetical protein